MIAAGIRRELDREKLLERAGSGMESARNLLTAAARDLEAAGDDVAAEQLWLGLKCVDDARQTTSRHAGQ